MLDQQKFDEINEESIRTLISNSVAESLFVEFKRDVYGKDDKEKREFVKDVSAFANTGGGHLIIGIAEDEGTASELVPQNVDADQEQRRMNSLLLDGIEPRISGFRIKPVPIEGGGCCFVVRIPKSWNAPHRVTLGGLNRFWGRNSSGTHQLAMEELRDLFTLSSNVRERIRRFRDERLSLLGSDNGLVPLENAPGRLIVHLVPTAAFSSAGINIDLRRTLDPRLVLKTLEYEQYNPRFNFEGLIAAAPESPAGRAYVQLFRNGSIEAVSTGQVTNDQGQSWLPSGWIEKAVFSCVPEWLTALRSLDLPPPLVIMISMQGVKGAKLAVNNSQIDNGRSTPFRHDTIELPETIVEDYPEGTDLHKALQPAFDTLWNAAGRAFAWNFDESGTWTPSK